MILMKQDNLLYLDHLFRLKPELSNKEGRHIYFQVTEDCNLCCSYCYQQNKTKKSLTFDTAKIIIDKLIEDRLNPNSYYYQEDIVAIVFEFIGGEPFLKIDLIEQICDYFESQIYQFPDCPWVLNHRYSFSTNGTLYFDERVQNFIKKRNPFVAIGVTVDGNEALHNKCRKFPDGTGSYDLALKAALAERERMGLPATKITVSPENVNYVANGIIDMYKLGFSHIIATYAYEEGWTQINAQDMYKQLIQIADWLVENNLQDQIYFSMFEDEKYTFKENLLDDGYCGVSQHGMLAVDHEGYLYPCIRFMSSSIGEDIPPFKIGDIDSWIGGKQEYEDNLKLLKTLTIRNMSPQKCLDCNYNSGCSYCTGLCYQDGDITKRTIYHCQMHQATCLATKYFYKITRDKNSFDKINIPVLEDSLKIISQDEYNFLLNFEEEI